MRTQECRERIDKAAEYCGLADSTVRQVKQAAEFATLHDEISSLPTNAVLALARIKNSKLQKTAIDRTANILKTGQRPTEKEIRDLVTVIRQDMGQKATPKAPPLQKVINQMRDNPPAKPPIESTTAPTTGSTFNIRARFPMPGTREEILFRQQINDIGRMTRDWMKNPDLAPLIPALQELRRKAREAYGELVGTA
jgi:hypothetical protein